MTNVLRRRISPSSRQRQQKQPVVPAAASAVLMTGLILIGTTITMSPANAFQIGPISYQRCISSSSRRSTIPVVSLPSTTSTTTNVALFSSVGNGGGSGGKNKDDNELGEFLDPMKKPDSEDMKRARQFMSETSLPISFDSVAGAVNDEVRDDDIDNDNDDNDSDSDRDNDAERKDADLMTEDKENTDTTASTESSSSLVSSSSSRGNATSSALFGGSGDNNSGGEAKGISPSLLAKNPYMQVVSKISPSDLIAKFTAESDPRVQEAVRTTILGLIGSLPKLAFETTSITTGQRLASLMFQLQMTGYMFKNAEYRLSMSQSLGMSQAISSNLLLTGVEEELPDKDDDPLVSGKIKGKLKIRYGKKGEDKIKGNDKDKTPKVTSDDTANDDSPSTEKKDDTEDGMEIEVDAAAYMSELRDEVSRLRDELTETKETKDEALRKDLLLYIRTLPAQELKSLTNTMSQDVLVCMKGLVQAVLAGIGDGKIGPDTVTEQSGEAMAQLCMWQLAVGYNLRELEVREEMKKNIHLMGDTTEDDIDLSEPGAFE